MSTPVRRLPWCVAVVLAGASGLFVLTDEIRAQKSGDRIDEVRRLEQVAQQKVEADVRSALRDAQRLAASNYKKGVDRLQKAITELEADTSLAESRREALKRMLQDRIRVTETAADDAAATAAALDEKQAQAELRRSLEERQAQAVDQTRRKQREVGELIKEGRTEEARRQGEELSKQQPNNPSTQATGRVASTADRVAESRKIRAEGENRRVAILNDVNKSALPVTGDVEFPKDWRERTKNRTDKIQLTDQERAILQALSTPITVKFKGSRFEDVIEYLQTFLGQPILLDRAALEEAQVTYDTPITVNVKGVTVRTLLRKVLNELNLTYIVREQTIQVTSALRARDLMVVRSYYIGDVLAGQGSLNPFDVIQNVNKLIDLIQNSIDSASWRVNGGSGSISFNPGSMSLVVKQSAEVHAQLAGGLLK